jgi:3-deoxy-D-manno-octulosonate 8-phosphate phosphatase (KDO 8-P phosphatase)
MASRPALVTLAAGAATGSDSLREDCMISSEVLARQQLLACDVDGVLTDGTIVYGSGNCESKAFSIIDGLGIRVARLSHFPIIWLARRRADAVARRAAELNVRVCQGVSDKAAALRELAAEHGVSLEEITYIGDDLDDLPSFAIAGLSIAVGNALPDVKAAAMHVTDAPGGHGAVREVIELIFRAQGCWDDAVRVYLDSLASHPTTCAGAK